jgi:hypothetical protein
MAMKKYSTLFFALAVYVTTFGQELRTKTNELHLSVKEPRSLTTVPTVEWVTPKLEYVNSLEKNIEIEAIIRSDIPIQNIALIIGDNVSGSSRGKKEIQIPENSVTYNLKQKMTLLEGSNYIEILVENINGAKVSGIRNVIVGKDAVSDAVAIDRKDYALFFATDSYDYWTDLVNPVYDANTIARELKEKYNFEVEVVENASQEEILLKIKDYSKRNYKPQDQLLIFFAGHGQFDEGFGEGYVVAKNSLESDKAKTTYISHSNLRSYVNNIACNHILLTMDVCFGGTLDPAIARTRSQENRDELTDNEFLARKLSKKTRRYITSGGKEYVSDGVPGKHSPFAARIIEALKTRGGDDQILTIAEILPYLEKIKNHEPRAGEFGDNEKGSDFVFVAINN